MQRVGNGGLPRAAFHSQYLTLVTVALAALSQEGYSQQCWCGWRGTDTQAQLAAVTTGTDLLESHLKDR